MKCIPLFACTFLSILSYVHASLKPGFDKQEYLEMLSIAAQQADIPGTRPDAQPEHSVKIYRSAVVGLENRWDLWIKDGSIAVISIRGTASNKVSWLANFYAAMLPASGTLNLEPGRDFTYQLADNPRAAVHAGWLISTAYLFPDILQKADSCCRSGIRNFIVTGHSQGGAIAYLVSAGLYQAVKQGKLPADTRIKTYCSAAPKPGNLYFAYDFEAYMQGGWAFNVVNSADWVPETPLSVQTFDDFNDPSVFGAAPAIIRKQRIPVRWVARYMFGRLRNSAARTRRVQQKYLGRLIEKQVRKHLPGYRQSSYYPCNDYVRTGNTIVLLADESYYRQFPDDGRNIFVHHMFAPYRYLTLKMADTFR